ncbi:VOC family protein [Halovulum marinum]|uniref:VOC family protein n=1 Tax=Halovulum marinum TaxID=2662447 RepID=UPI0012B2B9CE|nr:VOC family protein [Halovulum marinum]
MTAISKISPCLWFKTEAEEAANFYASVFPDSSVDKVTRASIDTPGTKTGAVLFVEFTLCGQSFQALNGGEDKPFTEAISLSVLCKDQAEVDRYWAALTAGGGAEIACGWLSDRYGLRWQVVPEPMLQYLRSDDAEAAGRAMRAMMDMVKLDVAKLAAAYEGRGAA